MALVVPANRCFLGLIPYHYEQGISAPITGTDCTESGKNLSNSAIPHDTTSESFAFAGHMTISNQTRDQVRYGRT